MRELIDKYQECFEHYDKKGDSETCDYKKGVLHGQAVAFLQAKNLLIAAYEAKLKAIDAEIGMYQIVGLQDDKDFPEDAQRSGVFARGVCEGLEKAKSILEGNKDE